MGKRRIILTEFAVTVFTDGQIDWGGFDGFLWSQIHQPPKDVCVRVCTDVGPEGLDPTGTSDAQGKPSRKPRRRA